MCILPNSKLSKLISYKVNFGSYTSHCGRSYQKVLLCMKLPFPSLDPLSMQKKMSSLFLHSKWLLILIVRILLIALTNIKAKLFIEDSLYVCPYLTLAMFITNK